MKQGVGVRLAGRLVLLTILCNNWAQAADPPPQKPLLWAADAEGGAPYISMDPEHPGQYIGFEVDLIKALEKEIGRPIKFQQFNFTNLASALNRGDIDFAMNGMERTPDRKALFRLSRPYYVFALQLVVRRNETRINSLEDCKQAGVRVGTLGDTAASRLLTKEKIPYRTYDSQTTPYKDLEQNQLDAVLLDLPIAMQYTQRDANFNDKLKFVGKPLSPGFYVMVFRKENEDLAAQFDAAIDRLRDNGTLKRIYDAWGLWNDDQAVLYALQLVVRRNETRINSLDDCRKPGVRVGTLGDTAASRLLTQSGIAHRTYDGRSAPYKDLEQNQLDAVLLDVPNAWQDADRDPEFNEKLKFAGRPISPDFYEWFRAAIDRLHADGTLTNIYQAWGYRNGDKAAPAKGEGGETSHGGATVWNFAQFFPRLLGGAAMTVALTFLGFLLAMAIGLPVATARLYGPAPLRWLATVYVEFFRGIPVLLLLFFLYYSLPEVGVMLGLAPDALKLNPFLVGVIGFGLNYGAYESEIYRAGISSIPIGQWEAAASLGMPPRRIFFRIILPQAVKVILPPMTNDFVALFKDTSVVSVIAVSELMKTYQIMSNDHFQYVEIGSATIVLYLCMSVPLAQLSRYLERRWGKGR